MEYEMIEEALIKSKRIIRSLSATLGEESGNLKHSEVGYT